MSDLNTYYDMNMRDTISTRRSTVNHTKLEHKRVLRIGVSQLLIGILCVMAGVFSLVASIPAWEVFYLTESAPGIWIGVLAFVTGLFSVNSSRSLQRKKFMMWGFFIMTMLTLIAVLVVIGLVIADLVTVIKAETRYDVFLEELRVEHKIEDDETVNCLNLTIDDWYTGENQGEDDVTTTSLMTTVNSTSLNLTDATTNISTTPENTTVNSTEATTILPDVNDVNDDNVRCIARSTFQQKFVIDSVLLFLSIIELIIASLSVYIIIEIDSRFKKEEAAAYARYHQNGNRVDLHLPGSSFNNNDYGLSNGHNVPVPKSIIQHTEMPPNDSFPDSDQFRSHLESFDCKPLPSNGNSGSGQW